MTNKDDIGDNHIHEDRENEFELGSLSDILFSIGDVVTGLAFLTVLFILSYLVVALVHEFGHALFYSLLFLQPTLVNIQFVLHTFPLFPPMVVGGSTLGIIETLDLRALVVASAGALLPVGLLLIIRRFVKKDSSVSSWVNFLFGFTIMSLIWNWWPMPSSDGRIILAIISNLMGLDSNEILFFLIRYEEIGTYIFMFSNLFVFMNGYQLLFPFNEEQTGFFLRSKIVYEIMTLFLWWLLSWSGWYLVQIFSWLIIPLFGGLTLVVSVYWLLDFIVIDIDDNE